MSLEHKLLPILLNAFDSVLLYYRTVKRLLIPVLQIRVPNGKLLFVISHPNTYMDLLNETVLLKTKNTLFNLLIRETSQFLCHKRLLNLTYVAYTNAFSAKCNSGRIVIQWFHIKHYSDYQYAKLQPYTFRVQKCVFARYATFHANQISMCLDPHQN